MKRVRLLACAFLLGTVAVLSGCTAHRAYVRGVAGDNVETPLPPDAAICVAVIPEGLDWKINGEITRDIETLLLSKGYRIADSSNAHYFLFFEFDREAMMERARFELSGGMSSGLHTIKKQGPFDLTLTLRLVEADAYHETGLSEFVWAGAAVLPEAPTESTKLVHLLLVAAMEPFPEETGKTIKRKIDFYDQQAKQLRAN